MDSQQCSAIDDFLDGVTSPPMFYCGKTEDCLAIYCSGLLQIGPELVSYKPDYIQADENSTMLGILEGKSA